MRFSSVRPTTAASRNVELGIALVSILQVAKKAFPRIVKARILVTGRVELPSLSGSERGGYVEKGGIVRIEAGPAGQIVF